VTLGRLVLAWLPVAVAFVIVGALAEGARWELSQRDALWRSVEAAAVTLFASLWFDSLGHGGWWLLFALVGFLVGVQRAWHGQRRVEPRGLALDVGRYVVAGAVLAWKLG
jgi:hypothetical protein